MDNKIRVISNQNIDGHTDQTLIYLPSFAKAWEIFETVMTDEKAKTNPLEQAQKDGLAISLHRQAGVQGSGSSLEQRKALVSRVWKEITEGPSKDFIESVESVCHVMLDIAYKMDPSLKPNNTWRRQEEGPVFDAGLIASEDERPCFSLTQPTAVFRKGDGTNYRLLINTDTSYGHSDAENCMATIGLVRCLTYFGEVELWIQQGWVGSNPNSGVTCFPIHKGQEITPALTWFWLASSYRDGTFSRIVNFALGRKNSGVSQAPQLEHDVYIANAIGKMPGLDDIFTLSQKLRNGTPLSKGEQASLERMAKWLADTVKKAVYSEEYLAAIQEDNQ